MLDIRVTGITQYKQKTAKRINQLLDRVSNDVLVLARANTPIRLGKARRGWKRTKQGKNYVVQNRVVYIDKLEQGSSKQAPQGILKPTLQAISRRRY